MQTNTNTAQKEMSVIVKAKNLMYHSCKMTANAKRFPKKYRFSIAARIENISIDIYESLLEANECNMADAGERRERMILQRKAIVSCKKLNSLLDLARNINSINLSSNSVEYWCGLVVEIKRMAAAWRNNERRQNNA